MALKMSVIRAVLLQNGMNYLALLTYKNEKKNATTATYEAKCCSSRGSSLSYMLEMRLPFNLLASLIETKKNLNYTDQLCQSKSKIKLLLSI